MEEAQAQKQASEMAQADLRKKKTIQMEADALND
jgi:hypothetical protein